MGDAHIIRRQQERIEELEEIIRQMKAPAKSWMPLFPSAWLLSRSHAVILEKLYRTPGHRATHAELLKALRDADAGYKFDRTSNTLTVQIFKMRSRLRPYGIIVRNIHGSGYELDPASVQKVTESLTQREAA